MHSNRDFFDKQTLIWVFCYHSNGLCTILTDVFRYSMDYAMTYDGDCGCTRRHMDRNEKEFASEQECFEH